MTYEKAVILDQLKETMQREQNANQYIFRNTDVSEKEINNIINSLDSLHEEKKKLLNYLQSIKTNDKKLELKLKNDIENIKENWLDKALRENRFLYECEEVYNRLGKSELELPRSLYVEAIKNAIKQDKSFKQFCAEAIQGKIEDIQERENNATDLEFEIVERLNSETDLRGKIVTDITSIRRGFAVVGLEILTRSIKHLFNIESKKDARDIGKYLCDFFNEVYGIFYDDFKNIKDVRVGYLNLHELTFIGYVALAKQLYKKENWQDKLEEILNKIDFSKENRELADLIDKNKIVLNKRNIEEIANYFTTLCKSDR